MDSNDKIVDLTPVKALVTACLEAQREAARWEDVAEILKKQVQAHMGEATHATCDGQEVFTYKPVGRLHVGRLKEEAPDVYKQYYRQRTVWELDRDALEAEQPDVYAQFRSRVFNRLVK